jgi:hypothetical protein
LSSEPANAAPTPDSTPDTGLPLEERKFQLDVQRFELERSKFIRDGSFFARVLPTLTTVVAALIGVYGVVYQQNQHQDQQAAQKVQQDNQAAAQTYIQTNLPEPNADLSAQIDQRAKILAANSPSVAKAIFSRLENQSDSAALKQVWEQGLQLVNSPTGASAPAVDTVYVHYREPTKDAAVTAVMTALTKAGYYVPGKQKVVQQTTGDVRFFADPSDASATQTAAAIAALVQDALANVNVNLNIQTMNLHANFPKMLSTTFEVWLPAMPNS